MKIREGFCVLCEESFAWSGPDRIPDLCEECAEDEAKAKEDE